MRLRVSLARAGFGERLRDGGYTGDTRPAADRVRAGGLLVLLAWALAVVGGCAFAKASEGFVATGPSSWSAAARIAHGAVVAGAASGAAVVVLAVLLALPAVPAFVRAGGWASVRAPVGRAVAASALVVVGTAGLASWAHRLTPAARNGADFAYGLAYLTWGAFVAATVVLWAVAGAAVARQLEICPRVVRTEAVLAVVLAAVIGVVALAVGVWWVSVGVVAPTFLAGGPAGSHPLPVTAPLVLLAVLLGAAVLGSVAGTVRIVRSWPSLAAD